MEAEGWGQRESATVGLTQRGMCGSFLVLPLLQEHDWPFVDSLGISWHTGDIAY